jgi:osmotically-inducible protein OsmY
MISDDQLQSRLTEEFRWDPRLQGADITICVREGMTTLAGSVPSNAVKQAALRAAERVDGVNTLANAIHVVPRGAQARSDADLAQAVLLALDWDTFVSGLALRARTDHGWVVLTGTVPHVYQRQEAETVVQSLLGVRGVTNLIEVAQPADPAVVAEGIRAALARSAILDPAAIAVEPLGDAVVLHGAVNSLVERELADQAARNSGVAEVRNELAVLAPLPVA